MHVLLENLEIADVESIAFGNYQVGITSSHV
jgi:hypothetical protein